MPASRPRPARVRSPKVVPIAAARVARMSPAERQAAQIASRQVAQTAKLSLKSQQTQARLADVAAKAAQKRNIALADAQNKAAIKQAAADQKLNAMVNKQQAILANRTATDAEKAAARRAILQVQEDHQRATNAIKLDAQKAKADAIMQYRQQLSDAVNGPAPSPVASQAPGPAPVDSGGAAMPVMPSAPAAQQPVPGPRDDLGPLQLPSAPGATGGPMDTGPGAGPDELRLQSQLSPFTDSGAYPIEPAYSEAGESYGQDDSFLLSPGFTGDTVAPDLDSTGSPYDFTPDYSSLEGATPMATDRQRFVAALNYIKRNNPAYYPFVVRAMSSMGTGLAGLGDWTDSLTSVLDSAGKLYTTAVTAKAKSQADVQAAQVQAARTNKGAIQAASGTNWVLWGGVAVVGLAAVYMLFFRKKGRR